MGEKIMTRAEKSDELTQKTIEFLAAAKHKGLVDVCNGSLPDVLNGIAEKAFSGAADDEFIDVIDEFGAYYNDPATQDAMAFFGVEVSESEAGEIKLIFAD